MRIGDYTESDIITIVIHASEMMNEKLQIDIPLGKFEIITTFDEFDSEIDAVIKLHTLRKEEASYIDIQSIDDYQQPIFYVGQSE